METNQLNITADLTDNDGTVGLRATLETRGFKGIGEGWFNISEVVKFCDDLRSIVDSMDGETSLSGGITNLTTNHYLECLGLKCYVIAKNGIWGVQVRLADPLYTDCRPEEIFKVTAELKVETQLMINFIQDLRRLCKGQTAFATLESRNNF